MNVYSTPVPWGGSIEEKLHFMREHGSSVLLNWGEDDNLWECSVISGGDRYTAFSKYLQEAVYGCLKKMTAPEAEDR